MDSRQRSLILHLAKLSQEQQVVNMQLAQCLIDVTNALPAEVRSPLSESLSSAIQAIKSSNDSQSTLFDDVMALLDNKNES